MGKNYALSNQIYLYSLQTNNFYTDDENKISEKFFKADRINKRLKDKKDKLNNIHNYLISKSENEELLDDEKIQLENVRFKLALNDIHFSKIRSIIVEFKEKLDDLLQKNTKMRELRLDSLKENKVISLFESTLTRTCGMKRSELTDDMFVVRIFHYPVLKSLLDNGFMYKGKHYSYFTSSAGQIRTKKTVFINTELYKQHENKITCGLPPEKINELGGINTNKYQAYLALSNSASIEWKRFNIDRIVVVDDICTEINGEVDYIDRDTYEITRKRMNVPVEHMDGCGIMLPSVSKKSFMFRMPWMKGLLTTFDFKKFATLHNQTKITDIYGKEYDIIEDNINIILTKSQFKLWKYYDSWEDYKTKFKMYKCEASKLNIEDIGTDANLNYQMLQTLPSMTTKELTTIAQDTIDDILSLGSDKSTMLRVLGATKENQNKNPLQKALLFYPELLSDNHSKQIIKDKKKSLVKDARHGKLRINGKYTYIIPDVYAFCEWLFLGIETPKGLLNDGEVYCDIYDEGKVDILRSPHLYKEHAIKINIKNNKLEEWFTTKGVYTSTYDLISKMLQFDNDGDTVLVTTDETLIKVAEREMKDIVPLYYEMAKAESTPINSDNVYNALTSAYKANIGIISNDITKIWNSPEPSLNAVKWLTMFNNFTIDYAKTLFLPSPPKESENEIKSFTRNKVPHFFKYAKDKEDSKVSEINGSVVNKLEKIIPNKRITFKSIVGEVDYTKLMYHKNTPCNLKVISEFKKLEYQKHKWMKLSTENNEGNHRVYVREQISKICSDIHIVVDSLVLHLYTENTRFKSGLWDAYGEILYENLQLNLGNTIPCENCNERTEKVNETTIYCEPCSLEIEKNNKKERNKRYYNKVKKI